MWKRVNSNLDVSVNREYLERECRRAQDTPSYENTFKRLHLNIRTQQDVRWLSLFGVGRLRRDGDRRVRAQPLRGRQRS